MGATKKTVRKAAAGTTRKAAGDKPAKSAAGKRSSRTTRKSAGKSSGKSSGKSTGKSSAKPRTKTTATPAARAAGKAKPRTPRALAEYQRKRDFSKTAEPSGSEAARESSGRAGSARKAAPLRFVIQKHAASHLHFDFRLELDGVMKSWAVPKGPSMRTGVRRLAMEVEDHPISYNSFEGTIPRGQYGGGTVMLWDQGHYLPADGDPASLRKGLRKGRLDIVMLGERLKGGFTLVRSSRNDGKPQWLLFKRSDEYADPRSDPVDKVVTSVVSGRTMDEIAEGDEIWHSNRA